MTRMEEQDYLFKKGAKVEISTDEEGFRGAWFQGTVVKPPMMKGNSKKVVVEYETLVSEEDETKPLREIIDLVKIRPQPPREPLTRPFQVSDEVDVFNDDAWWEGVVMEVVEGSGKYSVFFRTSREQLEFARSDLRLHREWIKDGVWDPPLEEAKPGGEKTAETVAKEGEASAEEGETSSKEGGNNGEGSASVTFNKGSLVEVRSDEEGFDGSWFAATIVEVLGKDRFLAEYKDLRTEDDREFVKEEFDALHMRPPPPEVPIDKFSLYQEVDALYNDGWWVGVISKVIGDSKYLVYFKDSEETLEFNQEELRLHWDWIAGKWVCMSKDLKLFD